MKKTVVVKLLHYKDKVKVLQAVNKLKGWGIYINEDFSSETREVRKNLLNKMKRRTQKECETWCLDVNIENDSNYQLKNYKAIHQFWNSEKKALRNKYKKRKIEDENRSFHGDWTEKYAFIEKENKPMCLICNTELAHNKTCNVKGHYETKHMCFSEEYPINSFHRMKKIELLKTVFKNQQMNISSSSKESSITTEASFIIAWNIAKSKHPYTDGEFVKQNLFDVISVLDPNNCKIQKLISNVLVKEELLDLVELKDTTRGTDLKEALDTVLVKINAPKNKLVSVARDGATAMVGKHIGLMGLLNSDPTYPEFIPVHCVIHREHLAAKHFNFPILFKSVLEMRSNAKNHRQFKNFISELDLADKPSDLSFYCAVRFEELLEPIKCFLLEKQKTFEIFGNVNFLQDLLFVTDVMQNLQNLNLSPQGKEKDISDFAQTIFSSQKKIALFQKDLTLKTFNHFPQIKKMIHNPSPTIQYDDHKIESYREKLRNLFEDFQNRFKVLYALKSSIAFLINPFLIDIISDGCAIPKNIFEEHINLK
ncbi:general transcription factor II-I repeat domain-containing protein 2A-like [Hydra vulgaris]|uniref:General transcription factor II-I repeat domain-containing protein 2A-like n=1 Tax=Hydra vulgaris TaxID=6087 RepID=A0ABM4DMD9_HYDVU